MKTRNTIKTTFSIILLLTLCVSFGQSNYLKISKSNAKNDFIKYPPGTTFQLTDENNNVVYSNTSSTKTFVIIKPHTLKVNPSYNNKTNTYYLIEGKVEIKSNAEYYKALEKHKKKKNSEQNYGTYKYNEDDFTNGLRMKKTLEPSTLNPEQFNATFEFNNGITATFTDGNMIATLNDKTFKIKGKYLIYSEFGLIKLSFSPKDGETWWVFEPNNK